MKKNTQVVLSLSVVGALGSLMMSGCSQNPSSSTANSFSQIYDTSFSVSCVNCHYAGSPSGNSNLDMSSAATAYAGLVGVTVQSPSNPSQCANVKRVVAGSPTNSYLMGVLFSSYNRTSFAGVSPCQPPTSHLSQVSLSAAEMASIESWITSGAAQ